MNPAGATECRRCAALLPARNDDDAAATDDTVEDATDPAASNAAAAVAANAASANAVAVDGNAGAVSIDIDAVSVDAIDAAADAAAGFPLLARFVGRQAMLARLASLVAEVARAGDAATRLVALVGAPGVGKTRLGEELGRRVAESGRARVYVAACGEPSASPFAAVERLLRRRLGLSDDAVEDEVRARLAAAVAELEPALPAARADEVTHLLGDLLQAPFADSRLAEALGEQPGEMAARRLSALRRFFAADAARTPLLLVLDEVERATPETVALVHDLAAGLGAAPVLILCLARPELFSAHPGFGAGAARFRRLDLGPLDGEEAAELVRELVRPAGPPPPALTDGALGRLGGVPRALTELVRLLVEHGAITSRGSHGNDGGEGRGWRFDAARLAALPLPDGLDGVLGARLALVPAPLRALLEQAAACGESFWLDALVMLVRAAPLVAAGEDAHAGGADGPSLDEVVAAGDHSRAGVESGLEALERRGLIRRRPGSTIPGEREYSFAYPPWREVVYARVDVAARRRHHRLLAQWLELRPTGRGEEEQEAIARHLERAGDGDAATTRYRRAADAARARYYNDKAVRLYEAALACVSAHDLATRIHLWHDLGSVFQLRGDFDAALDAFERMLRLAWMVASRTKAAVAFNKMGRVHRHQGQLGLAHEYLERGLRLFRQVGDTRGVAGSLDDIGQALWLMARYDEALDRSAAALETRRRLGDKRAIALSLVNIGNIERHRGLFDEAEACYREALDLRRGLGDRHGIAQCQSSLGALAFQRGDVATARRRWQAALTLAERIGAAPLQAVLLAHLGEAARTDGDRGAARAHLAAAAALARELDFRRLVAEAERLLGLLDLESGDHAQALVRLEGALAIAAAAGLRVNEGRALVALGEAHAATLYDDTAESEARAEGYFGRGVALFRAIGNDAELAVGLERFGRYRVERGHLDAGKRLLEEAEAIFTRLGMPADAVRRTLDEL